MTNFGYKTHFVSFNGGQTVRKWTFQGIVEYGNHATISLLHQNRTWQNYQLYTYYQPSSKTQYAVYSRLGYVQMSDNIHWAKIYGASMALAIGKHINWQLVYEYTDQKNSRQYLNSNVKYTFADRSYAELKGYWNKMSVSGNTLEFLLSYTIPWGLPVRKNRSIGSITGRMTEKEKPIPNLVVNCSGRRTITDSKGAFLFPDLTPGEYHLWIEEKEGAKIPLVPLPMTLAVQGGEGVQVQISFDHPCKVIGKIPMFVWVEGEMEESGGFAQATVILTSTETKQIKITQTDGAGNFVFEDLPPGRWVLEVAGEEQFPYHYLSSKEEVIDLFPGVVEQVEIKLLPIKRQLRMIDSDTVQSEGY